jgi:hypothetical protein
MSAKVVAEAHQIQEPIMSNFKRRNQFSLDTSAFVTLLAAVFALTLALVVDVAILNGGQAPGTQVASVASTAPQR